MASNARNLANLLGTGQSTISAEKLGSDVPPGTEDYSNIDSLGAGTIVGETAFVQSSNRLYIWNGSGWYNIALINTTPTWDSNGQPASSYELDADSPQDATVITLAASDPEGLPISYNYITSGSMDSIATISQDSSVFTITPKTSTQVPDGGTGSITFRATDGVNILPQVSSFTLNFITIVTNSKYTTLLVTATGTSDNNNITDTSTNNHTITVNGDAYAGTFSPYRHGGYSTYFPDTAGNAYVSANSSDYALGSGALTVSAWIYIDNNTQQQTIIDNQTGSGTGWYLKIWPGQLIRVHNQSSYIFNISNSDAPTAVNEWIHLCWTRDGSGNNKLFLNGTQVGTTVSDTTNFTAQGCKLGETYQGVHDYKGYMKDVHIVAGYANEPTTSSIATAVTSDTGTVFLGCSGPDFLERSSSPKTITISGNNIFIRPFSPYDYNEYDAADHGGSVYFDGNGDRLTIGGSSSDFNFGTNSFTIESWVYSTVAAVGPMFNTHRAGTGSGYYLALLANGAINWGNYVDGTGDITTAAGAFTQNTWNHISLNRDASSSNSLKIYVNGILKYTGTSATDYNTFGYGPFVGAYDPGGSQYYFTGYTSDIVVVNGSVLRTGGTSVGDVAFTPPTTPISTPSNTKLHIKGTDASIIDKSQGSNLKLVGNTTGSTTQAKFSNTKSMYFDGSGDYIVSQEPVKLGTQDFTAECWLYYQSGLELMGNRTTSDSGGFSVRISSTTLTVGNSSGTGFGSVFSGSTSSLTNAWHHIAVSRSSGVTKIYVDGTSIASHSTSINFSLSNPFVIGYAYTNGSGADSIQGWIQDFRITNGLARYTANFTPPTASLEG